MCSNIALADPLKNKTGIPQKDRSVISPNNIVIEKDHGLIKSKFTGNSKKLIINIQDAHCNYEAQTNIVNILEGLINNYSLSLVSVEGADGLIDTTWFKAFPDEEVRKEVATYFMKKGEITGPEYLSITKDYKIRLFGAEDRSSYIQNLNAFTSSYPLKADTEKYYNSIKAALSRLKGFIYNDGLKAMDVKSQDYESKKLQFNDYIRFLQEMAEKTKINIRSYDNFFRLVSVLIYEKKIDFTVTDKERSALIDELSKLLSKDALTELVSQSIAFKSGKISSVEFYNYIKKCALDNNIDISKTYPNLYNYIIYNSVYSRIENEKLFSDIKELETAIKEKLFMNDDQRALEKLSRHVEMLLGMVNIKLLNGDFNYYQTHRDEFTHEVFIDFIKKEGVKYGLAYEVEPPTESVAKAMPKLEDFYTIATKRDKALIENTLAEMDREKQDVAVLVTGGFHSEGMAKLLEKEGISYIVVCPAITKDVPTPYIQILTNQKAPFDDIVASPEAAKRGMLAPMLRTELMSMSRRELKNYLKDIPIPEEDLDRLEANIRATVEEITGKAYSIAVREWLKIVMKAISGHKLARNENFMKARYCDSVRAALKKEPIAGADNFVAMMKKAPEFNAAFHTEFSRAMPQQDLSAVRAAPRGNASETGAEIVSQLGVLPEGFEWVPGYEGKVCREKTLPGQSPSTIEYRQQPNGSWWVFGGGLPASGGDHARQESISSSLKTMITDAGLTPEILQDPKARAKKIAEYDAHVGGVREIIEGRSEEETTPRPANIQKGAISKEEKIGFLRSVAKGERAWAVFGAGRASRMKLPAVFDELGIAGLTPRILKALPRTDDPLDASNEMLGLIEFAREGNMRDSDDISFIQRQLIRLRNQIEQMVKETPEAGLTVEQVLAGVIFIDVVNEDNRDAMANQLLAIKFAGLNPGNIFFIEQPEEGGEEILPNGQTQWFDDERWPEGHGDPFIAIAQRPESAYRIGEGGRLVPTGKTLREVLIEKGTTKALFAQVNDLHLIEDMANVERWRTALALMAVRKAEMVMEMVDNKIVVKGEVTRQKGGATFNSRDDDSAIMRDTIALKIADLEKYAFPQSLSRMFYILDIASLGKVSETSIPAYLNERETRVGQKPVLTREFYSGDASSVLRSLTMQQGGGFDIYTFKMRSRIGEALTTIENQDDEAGFRTFIESLLAERRGVGAIRRENVPAAAAAEPAVIDIVKIDFATISALAKATGISSTEEIDALRSRLAEKVGKDKPSLGGSIVYCLGTPVWVMPYGIGFSEGRTAVFSLASEALIADFDTQASDWRLKEGVLAPYIGNVRAREGINVAIALANENSETFAMGGAVDWTKFRYGADNNTIVDRENPSIEYRRGPDRTFIGPQGGLPATASAAIFFEDLQKICENNAKYDVSSRPDSIRGRYHTEAVPDEIAISRDKNTLSFASAGIGSKLRSSVAVFDMENGVVRLGVYEKGPQDPARTWEYRGNPLTGFVMGRDGRIYAVVTQDFITKMTAAYSSPYSTRRQSDIAGLPIRFISEAEAAQQVNGVLLDPGDFIARNKPGQAAKDYRPAIRSRVKRNSDQVRAFLNRAGAITFEGPLRGLDFGSSQDLQALKELLTKLGATHLRDIPATTIFASKFRAKVRVEALPDEDKDKIVYVSRIHNITEGKPAVFTGEIVTDENGACPRGQPDAPAYILWNAFGLKGLKITFDVYYPGNTAKGMERVPVAGGMGTSGASNAGLYTIGSILSGADLSVAEIIGEATISENTAFKGYTGGQEGYATMLGGAKDANWQGGFIDEQGNLINHPYSTFVTDVCANENDFQFMEDHAVLVQRRVRYEKDSGTGTISKRTHRSASCINTMWMQLVHYRDAEGVRLFNEQLGYGKDQKEGAIAHNIPLLNKGNMGYVSTRDAACIRWARLVTEGDSARNIAPRREWLDEFSISDRIGIATYGLADNEASAIEKEMTPMIEKEKKGITITPQEYERLNELVIVNAGRMLKKNVSLYSDYAKDFYAAVAEEEKKSGHSMSAISLGAGGDGGIIALFSEGGMTHIIDFLERFGLEQFNPKEVEKVVTETGGVLSGYLPYEIGREGFTVKFEKMTSKQAEAEGYSIPNLPAAIGYNETTGNYAVDQVKAPQNNIIESVLGEFRQFSGLPVSVTTLPQVSTEGKTPSQFWAEVFSSIAFDETVYRRVEQEGKGKEQDTGDLAFDNANEGVDTDITPLNTYGKNDFPKIIRTSAQMQDVLMSPGTQAMPEAYYMYRGVFASRNDIQKAFHDNKIRYDITILPPGQWGSEPNKTFGHYHEPKDMPEIYQVLSGEAIYFQQKLNDKGEVVDAIMVRAKAGDIVIMLPGYGHVSINTSPDKPLVMANWLTWHQKSYYGSFEKNRGGAYYATRGADGRVTMDEKNPNYKNTPPLREMRPAESISAFGLKQGEPIYNLVHSARFPQLVRFLNYPKEYRDELTPERTLRPTAGYDEDADYVFDAGASRIVDDAVRESPITGQHATKIIDSMKVEAAGLQDALVQIKMTKASQKNIVPVVILFDTALDPNAGTTGVAQAGERAIKSYLGGSIIEVRGAGEQLLEGLREVVDNLREQAKQDGKPLDYKVVTIAGDNTLNEVRIRGAEKQLGQVINIHQEDENKPCYIPIIGLYDLALRLAYDLDLDNILKHLNNIATSPNGEPFKKSDLKRGLPIIILPKMAPVTGREVEIYKAAEAVLRSL